MPSFILPGNSDLSQVAIFNVLALRPYVRQRVKLGLSAVGCSICVASNSAGGT